MRDELRGKSPKELQEIADYLADELRNLHQDENGTARSLTDEQTAAFDDGLALRGEAIKLIERHNTLQNLADIPAQVERTAPQVKPTTRTAQEIFEDRSASSRQLADAVTRELEKFTDNPDSLTYATKLVRAHAARDRDWARSILIRSTEDYSSAFGKIMMHREYDLTPEERTALGVTTNANGKFLLPTHLDPTIMLTNAGSSNIIRSISRVVTLTDGQPAWNGVTSAGVTASWDGEIVEVSDDTPTVGQPSIGTTRAQALAQVSISAAEDIANLSEDLMMLFADARDRLEGAAHATGSGSGQPKGIFTALNADTNVQITSTTAATIGLVDIHSVYRSVPVRWRNKGKWLANPLYTLAVKALGTAVSASFSGDLTQDTASKWLNHAVVESDDAPTTQTTTALDNEIIYGDFSQFVIVDRPGGMTVEYIPHLFNTANNLPDGRRAWYATWRNGSDVTTTSAFRMLVDKTSA